MRHRIFAAVIATACALSSVHCSSGGGGGGTGSPTAPPMPQTVIISVADNAFSPKSPIVNPGDTVRWVMDGMNPGHTSTEMAGTWDSGFVFNAQGNFFERTFPASESGRTFLYFCVTHQATDGMQGSIRVGESAPPPDDGY